MCSAGELYAAADGVRCACGRVDHLCWLNGRCLCNFSLLLVCHANAINFVNESKSDRRWPFPSRELELKQKIILLTVTNGP